MHSIVAAALLVSLPSFLYAYTMDSLQDLLSGWDKSQPPEVAAIKSYVEDNFKSTPGVTVQSQQIIISVRSAALAGTLRFHLPQIKELANTDKRLVIRIGR